MSQFEISTIKDEKEELELEFKERFTRKIPPVSLKFLNEEEWREGEGENIFYKEVPSKELPEVLKLALVNKGVDAYTYEPHPLNPGYRLNITGKNPKEKLKEAVEDTEKKWKELEKLLNKEL